MPDAVPVFCSIFAYAACKVLGREWDAVHRAWLEEPIASPWPGFHAVGELRKIGPCTVLCDGSTLITKARSRAAGAFRAAAEHDVWLSIDDDVFAESSVIERVIRAARITRAVVTAPYILRGRRHLSFAFDKLTATRIDRVAPDLPLYRVEAGIGFGMTAVHREALEQIAHTVPWVRRGGGEPYPALFLEYVADGEWIGEDCSFARRCHSMGVPIYALLDATVTHADQTMRLGDDLQLYVQSERTADTLAERRQTPTVPDALKPSSQS